MPPKSKVQEHPCGVDRSGQSKNSHQLAKRVVEFISPPCKRLILLHILEVQPTASQYWRMSGVCCSGDIRFSVIAMVS